MDSNRLKELVSESLRDWFKKEDWVRIDTQGNITGPCGSMKKGGATTRCLPRKKAQSLSKAERAKTSKKKADGSRKGKQFVKNTEKAEYKKLDDGSWFAEIPDFLGVWANAKTLDECRSELIEILEEWLILKIKDGDHVPIVILQLPIK